jgi:hypothetical protein
MKVIKINNQPMKSLTGHSLYRTPTKTLCDMECGVYWLPNNVFIEKSSTEMIYINEDYYENNFKLRRFFEEEEDEYNLFEEDMDNEDFDDYRY